MNFFIKAILLCLTLTLSSTLFSFILGPTYTPPTTGIDQDADGSAEPFPCTAIIIKNQSGEFLKCKIKQPNGIKNIMSAEELTEENCKNLCLTNREKIINE